MNRTGSTTLVVIFLLLLSACPAVAGRIFVDAEMGKGYLNPGGFPTVAVADTMLAGFEDFSSIDSSSEFGGRLGYQFSNKFETGIAVTRQLHEHVLSDALSMRKYNFPANFYEAFLSYSPLQSGRFRMDIGVTAGMVTTDGTSTFSIMEANPISARFEGDAFAFSGFTTAEYAMANNASIFLRAGYRQAEISELDDGEGAVMVYEEENVKLDFSGVFLRIGLRFYVN